MDRNNMLELSYEIIELVSNYDDDILTFVTDNTPGLKIVVRFKQCISDILFKHKVQKFERYAKEFLTSQSFERFKVKINKDNEYRKKVAEYILLKINKFDTDMKLNLFAKVCIDFFEGNITEEDLESISEVLDNLTKTDNIVLKSIFENYERVVFESERSLHIPELDFVKVDSAVKKLSTLGVLENHGVKLGDRSYLSTNINDWVRDFCNEPLYTSYRISDIGEILSKYL